MEPLLSLLSQLGLGLATNAIYDLLKGTAKGPIDRESLAREVQNKIDLSGVKMRAETVITALAENGFLSIKGSHLYAAQSLVFGSTQGGAIVGDGSSLQTARTATVAGPGAYVQTQGNAQISQNADGSISFHVGGSAVDRINFLTTKPK
jgi:hypothetical protein